jgi:tetraacyldisaccharide 4'-kinase
MPVKGLLGAMSSMYGAATAWRRQWYAAHPHRQRRLRHPIVSVGNLSVGGTGKTPVVARIARLLLDAGERPAILSRGYGRIRVQDGVTVVSDGTAVRSGVEAAGDEPLMLGRSLAGVPVLVGADRYVSGRLAEEKLGATVHVLDDGFQYLELARDVDLLLLREEDLSDAPLPSGRLREPLAAASIADAVLVEAGDEGVLDRMKQASGGHPLFVVTRRQGPARTLQDGNRVPSDARVLAVAGIARPHRFFHDLAASGWNVVETMSFPDHHWFSRRDLDRIAAVARSSHAVILTTEKDAVRLERHDLQGIPIAAVPLDVTIDPAPGFAVWLAERLQAARDRSRHAETSFPHPQAGTVGAARREPVKP